MSLTYAYRANPTKMVLGALFFGACGALFVHLTLTNDRGVIIDGVIELGPQGATIFWGVLAGLSLAFVLTAVFATVHGMIKKPVLKLTDEHIVMPTGLLRPRPKVIGFSDITEIAFQEVHRQRFLIIGATAGKTSIARSLLESDAAFEEIILYIREHTPHLPSNPA